MKLIDLLNVMDEETNITISPWGYGNVEVETYGMNGMSERDKEMQAKMLPLELLNSEIETMYDNKVITNFYKEKTEKMLKEGEE